MDTDININININIRHLTNNLVKAKSSIKQQRKWNTVYNNKTSDYWNSILWYKILETRNIKQSSTINKLDLIGLLSNYINHDDIIDLLSRITTQHKDITQKEFNHFLECIEDESYTNIINLLKSNTLKQTIINASISPIDTRDWIYDNIIKLKTETETEALPKTLDYRKQLQPVRDQGQQGTCYAQSAACMKEWQEMQDYGLNEYLSPQFLYNIRENLYDDISYNDEGMYGRNVMKLLKNIGICLEKSYRYERIENHNKMATKYFLEAKQHRIQSYARITTLDGLKLSLLKNGPCLIVLPVYNNTTQFWYKHDTTEKLLGGHAMTVVGYNSDSFIIRNSWGISWGDNGYTYYYFKNWGLHWEIWTTIDEKSYKSNLDISNLNIPNVDTSNVIILSSPDKKHFKYKPRIYKYILSAIDWVLKYIMCIKKKIM